MKNKIIGLTLLLLIIGTVYLYEDNQRSYSNPVEAINKKAQDTQWMSVKNLIASSKINNQAVYFYVNKYDQIVGVRLTKGIFGWRMKSSSTGSNLNINDKIAEPINGHSMNGPLVFGLATEKAYRIEVNNTLATTLSLDAYLKSEQSKGKQLWYVLMDKENNNIQIRVYDKNNKEI